MLDNHRSGDPGERAMIASNILRTFSNEVRQVEGTALSKALLTKRSPQRIEHLTPLSRAQKLRLRLSRTMKVKAAAYRLSAMAGLAAGQGIQHMERDVTGYDPVRHAQLLENRATKIALRDAYRQEHGVAAWFDAVYRSTKQIITNPQELVEQTEIYQSLLEKYYNTLKVIDQASFIAPALLLFIMLGGYLERRLNRIQDDVVDAVELERLRCKINELVDAANGVGGTSDRYRHPS